MFEALAALLQQQWDNQVFAGGLALGALGAVAALLGRLAWAACRTLGSRLFPSLVIDQRSPLFPAVQAWLRDHPYTHTCRTLAAASTASEKTDDQAVWLVPGEGTHVLRHGRTWFWLDRSQDSRSGGSDRRGRDRETLRIRALALRRDVLTTLVDDILRGYGRRAGTIGLHATTSYGEWGELGRISRRSLDSVFVRGGLGEDLMADARTFLGREAWYGERGIPWRRGYLFHGPPGTGKTSLIRALVSELDLDLALVDLSQPSLDDSLLRELLARLPAKAALVLEDVDSVVPGREDTDRKLSLSGLLNALDGLGASEGRLLFMTTNHPGRLDPALIRPGRIDRNIEIGLLGAEDVGRMVSRFFPGQPDLSAQIAAVVGTGSISGAELQALLLDYMAQPEMLLKGIVQIIK